MWYEFCLISSFEDALRPVFKGNLMHWKGIQEPETPVAQYSVNSVSSVSQEVENTPILGNMIEYKRSQVFFYQWNNT